MSLHTALTRKRWEVPKDMDVNNALAFLSSPKQKESPSSISYELKCRAEQNRLRAMERLKKRKSPLAFGSPPAPKVLVVEEEPQSRALGEARKPEEANPKPRAPSSSLAPAAAGHVAVPQMKRARHPAEYKQSLLSARCKDWMYLFRFGSLLGVQVLKFLDIAGCCVLSSTSHVFHEIASKVEHSSLDFFEMTSRRRARTRKLITADVVHRVLKFPGCRDIEALSIKGCTTIKGSDLRTVFKDPDCKCDNLKELDLTGCQDSVQSISFFTHRSANSLRVRKDTCCLCSIPNCDRRVCYPDHHSRSGEPCHSNNPARSRAFTAKTHFLIHIPQASQLLSRVPAVSKEGLPVSLTVCQQVVSLAPFILPRQRKLVLRLHPCRSMQVHHL